jgi:hypothetical protein
MQKEITLQEVIESGKKKFIGYKIINNDEEHLLHSFKDYNFSKCIFIGKFKGIKLSHANLSHANLTGVNLYNADLSGVKYNKYTKIPSPAVMLLAQWQNVSDDLCLELMRYDAANHPSPYLF